MARVKRGVTRRRRHKKVLRLARGMWGSRSKLYRPANEAVLHALWHAYRHRRQRKGEFRRLWIARINAATRQEGLTYSRFIAGLKRSGVTVNRKVLAELAVVDAATFSELVAQARQGLSQQ
jgi:large subunit ribosomal protein L20